MAAIDRYGASQTAVSGGLFTISTVAGTGTVANLDWWSLEMYEIHRLTEEFKKASAKVQLFQAWVPGPRDAAPQRVQMAGVKRPKSRRPHGQGQGCR
jgi:hypothetical protein